MPPRIRGVFALVAAVIWSGLPVLSFTENGLPASASLADYIGFQVIPRLIDNPSSIWTHGVGFGSSTALIALLVYAGSELMTGRGALEAETRCRKCGCMLRGLTEPRCPECEERI